MRNTPGILRLKPQITNKIRLKEKVEPGPIIRPGFIFNFSFFKRFDNQPMKHLIPLFMLLMFAGVQAQNPAVRAVGYHTPEQTTALLKEMAAANSGIMKISPLCKTFSGTELMMAEIGTETRIEKKTHPALLVVANLEGTTPLATEGALRLIRELLADPQKSKEITWYILPLGNPDGARRFFTSPLRVDGRNFRPWNDDMDEATDEDGPDDLNGDGLITQMRVKDPEGTMIPDDKDPRLMKRADPAKGEKGIYKLYTEGLDNDGDGQYNEDGDGGTNIGITFPHLYGYNQPGTGAWSGSEAETYAIMQFMTAHPEIALTMTYGSTNFCLVPPKATRKSTMSLTSIKLPERYARMLNADPDKTYSLEEVKEMMKAIVPPGTTVDDSMVAGMLDQGAVVNPLDADLKVYNAFAEKYKEYLKGKKFTGKRLDPARDKDGSFELWAYYQLGLPSFSMDFWGLPEPPKSDTAQKRPSAGEAPARSVEPQKDPVMTAFIAYNDKDLGGKGFVPWTEVAHPVFGKVEVGGIVPFADQVPKPEIIDSLVSAQVPWIFELAKEIPRLEIFDQKIEPQGAGIFRVSIWVRNNRLLPFPIAMGARNKVPPPAIVTLTGKDISFVSGRARTPFEGLGGFEQRKLSWLIRADHPEDINISIKPVNAFGSERTIKLGGN